MSVNTLIRAAMVALTIVFGFAAVATPEITGVKAQQRYPWNGKVDVEYTATGVDSECTARGLTASLRVLAIDTVTHATNVAEKMRLSGDTTMKDGRHRFVWDMDRQKIGKFMSTGVVFTVVCETRAKSEEELVEYMVIDLTGGTDAGHFPVSYTNVPASQVQDVWKDDVYKTTKIVLRRCPAGTDPLGRYILTKDFYAGVFEVTQKQWELVRGVSAAVLAFGEGIGYYPAGDTIPVHYVSYDMIRGSSDGAQWPNSAAVDADSFLGMLRAKTGVQGLDLPTEAQWEYACRAGATTDYYFGDDASVAYKYMWYQDNSYVSEGYLAHRVGNKIPNAFGLYDMHGNVTEWGLDDPVFYYPSSDEDPVGAGGIYTATKRCFMGGDAIDLPDCCALSYRAHTEPSATSDCCMGFRLFCTPAVERVGACLCSGRASPVRLDLLRDEYDYRYAAATEMLTYSTAWEDGAGEGAVAVITINGETLSSATGSGTVEWKPTEDGWYDLSYVVRINGEDVCEEQWVSFVVEAINPGNTLEFTPSGCDKSFPVEEDWVISNGVAKVGDRVSVAIDGLNKPSGKTDIDGHAMFVWQDYVAGTDPKDKTSQFLASIEMQGNNTPVVRWTPDLGDERAYKVWGKSALGGTSDWTYPANALHRFFKVTVEMP